MSSPQIVRDANVIVQSLVRDLLLDADANGLCRVRWTEAILAEARRTLIGEFGRDPTQIDALLAAMRRHFPRAAIVGSEARIAAMTNDPKDRHVAAAAVRAGVDIATFNLRHFRSSLLIEFAERAKGICRSMMLLSCRLFGEQYRDRHGEGMGDLGELLDRRVAFAPLDPRVVRPI